MNLSRGRSGNSRYEALYADNMHYMGGCLLTDNLSESTVMFSHTSCPPDSELVGERWREMWLERLNGSGLWLETWLRHKWLARRALAEDLSTLEVIKDNGCFRAILSDKFK